MNAFLLAPGADLIAHIADSLDAGTADLSDVLVVFPGKRPGFFLLKELAARRRTAFVPPRILSMDELIDEMYAARHPEPRPLLESIDAVALLYDIQKEASLSLGGDAFGGNEAFLAPDTFFPLGVRIFSDLEELRIEGIEPRRVEEVQPLVEEGIPARIRENLQTMRRFYEELYPRAERTGFSTRSGRYREVCTSISSEDLAASRRVIFAGFFALTSSERRLFADLGLRAGVEFLFQDGEGMREKLAAMGIRAAEPAAPEPAAAMRRAPLEQPHTGAAQRPQTEVRLFQSPDSHGQVFALNALLDSADERTVIVLPSADSLFPVQRHCLSRLARDDYNVSLGYPLVRTPVYGFLNDLMELVSSMDGERLYVPRYLTFMLHPYTKNTLFRGSAEASRVLLHALEDSLTGTRTRMFATLDEIEGDDELFLQASFGIFPDGMAAEAAAEAIAALRGHLHEIHEATIGRFRAFSSVSDFARRCIDVLTWVHDSTTAREHPYFSPFAESFIAALETISRSLMRDLSFLDLRSYFTLLRRCLESRYQRFPGTPLAGLQVLGSLETRNLSFDRVFILDAVEGALPQAGSEDTLLPFSVRRALGLPTRAMRDEMEAYYFSLLRAGARELTVFFTDNGEKERSRFVEQLLWEQQERDRSVRTQPYVTPIQYRVTLENAPPAAIPKGEELAQRLRGRAFSASALDAYLRCPLSFYYSKVLGLSPREDMTGEYEKRDIGTLVHEILGAYFSPSVGRQLEEKDLDHQAMSATVSSLFEKRYGTAESGANRLLLRQIQSRMADFIERYMRPLIREEPLIMTALELEISSPWSEFRLSGRLDAVQRRGKRLVVVDYKTGHNAHAYRIDFKKLDPEDRSTWSAAIGSLQLPIYRELIVTQGSVASEEPEAMFLLLGRSRISPEIELPLYRDQEEALREQPRLRDVIRGLLREIVSPEVPFEPAEDRKRVCPSCDFNGICGTRWLR